MVCPYTQLMELAIRAEDGAGGRRNGFGRWRARTPVMTSAGFDHQAGMRVFFKCENLQRGGAFKIRVCFQPDSLPAGGRTGPRNRRLFIRESRTGYRHRGPARGCASHHRDARGRAALPRWESTRGYGARIVHLQTVTPRTGRRLAVALLKETGATLVPPFDHPMIMAGQGTAALELLQETGPLDALITPVGGGGLLSGCATIAKALHSRYSRVWTVSRRAPMTRFSPCGPVRG